MPDIFDSEFDSGFHAGDINVDNDKILAESGSVVANDGATALAATGTGSVLNTGEGGVTQAKDSTVLQNSDVDNLVQHSPGAVTTSGEGNSVAANTGFMNKSTLANGDVDDTVNGDGNVQVAPDGGGVGAFNFGSGSATNVEHSILDDSVVGNQGSVQQIHDNTLGDGAALGGRDAIAHNDFSVDESSHNLSEIVGDHNNSAVGESFAAADQSEHTDVTDINDSFKSFDDHKHFSDDDTVLSHSNVADHGGDLDFDF